MSNVGVRNRSDRSRNNGQTVQHNGMLRNELELHSELGQHSELGLHNVLRWHNVLVLNNGLEMQHNVGQHELNKSKPNLDRKHNNQLSAFNVINQNLQK